MILQGNSPRASPPPPSASSSTSRENNNNAESAAVAQAGSIELEDLRALVESRTRDIEELRNDRATLKMDIDGLKAKVSIVVLRARQLPER